MSAAGTRPACFGSRSEPGWTCLALLLCACAPADAPEGQRAAMPTLTATDISDAMGYSMPPDPDLPGLMCAIVEDIRCAHTGRRGRLQCSFREIGRETRRTALFERTGKTEWEREGHWRWVSGWRWCGRYF
jgi:hypothetical protein